MVNRNLSDLADAVFDIGAGALAVGISLAIVLGIVLSCFCDSMIAMQAAFIVFICGAIVFFVCFGITMSLGLPKQVRKIRRAWKGDEQ